MITLAKWSIEDYHHMIAAGILSERHVELLEGKIIEMSPEGPLHRKINDSMADYLREKLRGRAKIYEAHPVTLPDSEPEPDIAVVKLPVSLYDHRHPSAEEIYLLIEISDTTLEKDLEQKRIAYAQAGILEYWVVDLKAQQLIVFQQPSGDSYQIKQTYSQGSLSLVVFPDIQVTVEKLISKTI
ncbi:MAG: Uma2 family endonuclease [Moorea sp. SIO1G6]|uniref:Uma2 family endonuclease n=1 Tax=Moorena producens (strain JHB) TaxID=1454205 RepID=A0A1D9FUQ8_MOOP1|nr:MULTISPECIES: Uma2 family endonuclease [Moorena]AOY79033.1 Uma2 family endonuclease [Moorena producens JHB]NES86686.1 Uma2 family endonuclease [Moorena sp. SIO2B7]NET66191.1 Uma2 family endonuclease [Moorena sp. SIO1G6]